jgi:hypothetical protein
MDKQIGEIDKQIEATKAHLRGFLFTTFSYGDKLKSEIDPEISIWNTRLLGLYSSKSDHLSDFLDVVNKYVGDDTNIYDGEKVFPEVAKKLTLFSVLLKCGPWFLKQASDEDFTSFVEKLEKGELPDSLSSDAEIARLKKSFENVIIGEISSSQQNNDIANVIRDNTQVSPPAVDILTRSLEKGTTLNQALEIISKLD